MESSFSIKAHDGKQIYGFIHRPAEATDSVVILVHGLTGNMNEHIHINLAQYLSKRGYAVIRFNQYGDGNNARVFCETTISLHVSDTRQIIEYAQSLGFQKLIFAGHSLGSPVAIAATDTGISALILLDPTGPPKERIKDWQTYDAVKGISYLDWPLRTVLGDSWIEDAKHFPDSYEQFSRLTCPVFIIAAEEPGQMVYCEHYRKIHPSNPEIMIIPGATHCFTEEGAVEALGSAMITCLAKCWMVDSLYYFSIS